MTDTIFALATAPGKAGVSVIRVSGPAAFAAGETLAGPLPAPRHAVIRKIRKPGGAVLDEGLVLTFAEGQSFTGEASVELQLHGSPAITNAVLAALGDLDGLRHAEAGEFTRRALENDRLDLAQVEGLADLIDAETEAQRKQAYAVFAGKLGEKAAKWRTQLIRAASLVEATIDFADEDVPVDVTPEVAELLEAVTASLAAEIAGVGAAERLRDGYRVAIVGHPNSGKSTLLNYIAGRDVAITSEIAGTTRDVIEVFTEVEGLPITFLDTAGLRGTEDVIEALGVERARKIASEADLRIFLEDASGIPDMVGEQAGDIRILGKADENGGSVSGKTGQGVRDLLMRVAAILGDRAAHAATATRQRHQEAMEAAFASLRVAQRELVHGEDRAELNAEAIRVSLRALDQLVGHVDVEHLLDEIFSSFCIGK